jgi:hypothetical protein
MLENKDLNPQLSETAVSSSRLLELIDKLPHSKTRVPYTYHHDYLRRNTELYKNSSRSDVASSHKDTDIELYAVALIELLDGLGSRGIFHLSSNDIQLCKKALEITKNVLSRYDYC